MLQAGLLDEKGKEFFRSVIDPEAYEELDVWVGLLDDETETACGVLGAASVPDGEEGHALSIGFLSVASDYDQKTGKRILVRFLLDLAAELECSAVTCIGQFLEGADDENEQLLSDLGFFGEEEKMPLYAFQLSDVAVKKIKGEYGCLNLSELNEEQWEEFVYESEYSDFMITSMEDYEKKLSVFLVDDEKKVKAGILLSLQTDLLFVEGVFANGGDVEDLVNDLAFWAADGAKKRLSPENQVDLFLPAKRAYRDILMGITDKKAKKVGNLMTYTYQTPVL